MAMYYYASKLNEASCSGCHIQVPPPPSQPPPAPPPPAERAPLPPDSMLLQGSALSYYDHDDYYSMVRGNKFISEGSCKIVMNGGINFVSSQKKGESTQLTTSLECPGERPDIEYKDGQIISATLDVLIDMLRPGASKSFYFTFLLCSRLYIKPHELLHELCNRYFTNFEKIGKNDGKNSVEKGRSDMMALVRILDRWTTMFPYDFRDDRVMALVRSITEKCTTKHMDSVRDAVSVILEKLLEKLTTLEEYEESLTLALQVRSVDALTHGDILSLGLAPLELANHLTVVELYKLSFVGPEEFVQTFAPAQNQASTSSYNSGISLPRIPTKTTRNLEAYANWFNKLSYVVATDIVKAVKSKHRGRVLEQWVMTARECFNLGNFNSLMAIISALNMSPIARLKKTWGRTSTVCGQQLRQLELCVEPSGNHARYRAALAAAPTETAVPLLSVTCRDLHFANQGSSSKLNGNRVNFEKCSLLARHVNMQLASRNLTNDDGSSVSIRTPYPPVWRYLNDQPTLSETALELVSFDREAPSDNLEKERFKRLRGAS